jgi:hypothetical protein
VFETLLFFAVKMKEKILLIFMFGLTFAEQQNDTIITIENVNSINTNYTTISSLNNTNSIDNNETTSTSNPINTTVINDENNKISNKSILTVALGKKYDRLKNRDPLLRNEQSPNPYLTGLSGRRPGGRRPGGGIDPRIISLLQNNPRLQQLAEQNPEIAQQILRNPDLLNDPRIRGLKISKFISTFSITIYNSYN